MFAQFVFLSGVMLGSTPGYGLATLPLARTQAYHVVADPEDPFSPRVWTFELQLTPVSRAGDTIRWSVERMRIVQYGDDQTPARTWATTDVWLGTPDGYWTIEHANGDLPAAGEFASPPLMSGAAAAIGTNDYALGFEFRADESGSPGPLWEGLSFAQIAFEVSSVIAPPGGEPPIVVSDGGSAFVWNAGSAANP